jgi:nitrogen fixation/metabolism regulation signal transduction histidine kinase
MYSFSTLQQAGQTRNVTVKHMAPSLAKMVRVQKTKNSEDPAESRTLWMTCDDMSLELEWNSMDFAKQHSEHQ